MNATFTNPSSPSSANTNGTADASAVYAAVNPPPAWESRFKAVPTEWHTVRPPDRQWLLRNNRTMPYEGVFPMGRVGLVAAEGGAGKTMALVQGTRAVAMGTTWLGVFDVPEAHKVLIILAEEDDAEGHRRFFRAAEGGDAPPDGMIVTANLAGVDVSLITPEGNDSAFLIWLREYVRRTGPYGLIILDPHARFAAPEAETSNHAATRSIIAAESLIEPAGGAAVILSMHTNQVSRGRDATVDVTSVRGTTGLTDAARWVSVMQAERVEGDAFITLSVVKSNYAKYPPPVRLRFSESGVLVLPTEAERERVDQAKEAASPRAKREKDKQEKLAATNAKIDATVVSVVTANQDLGTVQLKVDVAAAAGCSQEAAGIAIARVRQAGRIKAEPRPKGQGKGVRHVLVDPPVTSPPSTPKNETSNTTASPVVVPDDIDEHMIDEQFGATAKNETPKTDTNAPTPTSTNGVSVEKPAADVYDFLNPYGDS
jgi:RecA-family ATPase